MQGMENLKKNKSLGYHFLILDVMVIIHLRSWKVKEIWYNDYGYNLNGIMPSKATLLREITRSFLNGILIMLLDLKTTFRLINMPGKMVVMHCNFHY